MDTNYVDFTFVLDASGSMSNIVELVQSGFNKMVTEQKQVPGKMRVTMAQFDTSWTNEFRYKHIYNNTDIHDVKPLEFSPGGGTPLYDAVARAIDETGARLRNMPEHERPHKVMFVIMTDGGENASKEYDRHRGGAAKLMEKVRHQEEQYGWTFVFIGADQDAFKAATDVGFKAGNAMNFAKNSSSVDDVFGKMSGKFSAIRTRAAGSEELTRGAFYSATDYADQQSYGADNSMATAYGAYKATEDAQIVPVSDTTNVSVAPVTDTTCCGGSCQPTPTDTNASYGTCDTSTDMGSSGGDF